ncbi:MAG: doubled motif LPXTG anchor domain-containing protein [Oscillibacter sp.]
MTIYYELHLDLRQESAVLVNHHYKVQDTYTGRTTEEGTLNQRFTSYKDGVLNFNATGIYVGAVYQATLVTEHDGKTYAYADSNYRDYTITIEPVQMSQLEGEESVQTNNIINIYYLRTISSDPGTPPPTEPIIPPVEPDNDPEEGYGPGENPLENIVTPEVPLADLPETEIPLTELPETEVPLAEAPATGDNLAMWIMAAAISGLSLVWLMISGKKREDENAE